MTKPLTTTEKIAKAKAALADLKAAAKVEREAKKAAKEQRKDAVDIFESIMGNRDAAKEAARGRVA